MVVEPGPRTFYLDIMPSLRENGKSGLMDACEQLMERPINLGKTNR